MIDLIKKTKPPCPPGRGRGPGPYLNEMVNALPGEHRLWRMHQKRGDRTRENRIVPANPGEL